MEERSLVVLSIELFPHPKPLSTATVKDRDDKKSKSLRLFAKRETLIPPLARADRFLSVRAQKKILLEFFRLSI